MKKLWFADIVTDMMSSDQVDHADEKLPSCDRIGLNYVFWCYIQDTEHSTDGRSATEEEKCQTFQALSMVVVRGGLECFMFWIKRNEIKWKGFGYFIIKGLEIHNIIKLKLLWRYTSEKILDKSSLLFLYKTNFHLL